MRAIAPEYILQKAVLGLSHAWTIACDAKSEVNMDMATASTIEAVEHFNEVFNRHDVDAIMAAMTNDCVFENTAPFPDGTRYVGQTVVRAFWVDFFAASLHARFSTEDMFAADDRCVVRWRYDWGVPDGEPRYIRGVDVFRVRDGKVAEKLAYVKG